RGEADSRTAGLDVSCTHLFADERQPAPVLRQLPADGLVERVLNTTGDRPRFTVADDVAIHLADKGDFHCGTREKQFIAAEHILDRQRGHAGWNREIAGDVENG